MRNLTKSELTDFALKILTLRNCEVWRQNNLAVRGRKFIGRRGLPDIQGYHKHTGVAVYCEVKTHNDRLSDDQIAFMNNAAKAGCICIMAVDVKGQAEVIKWGEYYK